MRMLLVIAALSLIPFVAQAQSNDRSDAEIAQDAIKDTQDLMTNSKRRDEAIRASPAAIRADARVKALSGSQAETDEIYAIAADLIAPLMAQAANDPKKMQELLSEAQKNPAALERVMTPEQKARIGQVAGQIEGARTPASAKP